MNFDSNFRISVLTFQANGIIESFLNVGHCWYFKWWRGSNGSSSGEWSTTCFVQQRAFGDWTLSRITVNKVSFSWGCKSNRCCCARVRESNILSVINMIKFSSALLKFCWMSFILWTVVGSVAWILINCQLNCNFFDFIGANNTDWVLPSNNVVGDGTDCVRSFARNWDSIQIRSSAVSTHHNTTSNWALGAICVNKERRG